MSDRRGPFGLSSLAVRLWSAIAVTSSALILGAVLVTLSEREMTAQTAREITADVQALHHVSQRAKMAGALDLLEKRGADGDSRIYYALWDDESGVLIASNLPETLHPAARAAGQDAVRALPNAQTHAGIRGRTVVLDDGYSAFIGRRPPSVAANGLLLMAIGTVIAALIIGWLALAERRAMRGLQQRLAEAEAALSAFTAGQRDRRIGEPDTGDALGRLAGATDNLLDYIAHRLASQDVVAEQIAHELRSPVAHAARRLSDLSKAEDGMARIVAQRAVAQLLQLIDAVLFITDLRTRPLNRTQFRLDLCLHDLCDLYAAAAEEKGVALSLDLAQTMVSAERALVERMAANLLDNAIKYTGEGGTIRVITRPQYGGAMLRIDDEGMGLSALPEQPGRLLARGPMVGEQQGSGLGLALVMRIMALHNGHLELLGRTDVQGLSARAIFPAYSSTSENAAQ